MREIKFRAWNVITKIMVDLKKITPFALNMDTDGLFIPFSDGLILMQYTGLKDMNGKEIYEGDILQIGSNIGKVYFKNGCFLMNNWGMMDYHLEKTNRFEIIGNIHENKELLNDLHN